MGDSDWLCVFTGGDVCITGHDSGPVFEEQPSSVVYPEGLSEGKVTLNCQARASPAATYSWRVNGTDVPVGDPRYTLVAGNLVISGPQFGRDGGSYQCLAINRCGTILSRAANLKFGYLNDFPGEGRSPQTAYEGAGAFLACQPPAHYPVLSYRWFVSEFPSFMKPDGGRWFVSQVTGNLYLAKAEPNDTASYFCFTTINMDISTKSTFSKANQLTVQPDANARKSAPAITVVPDPFSYTHIHTHIHTYIHTYNPLSPIISPFLYLSIHRSLYLSNHLSLPLSLNPFLSISPIISPSLYRSIHPSLYLSHYLSLPLSLNPSLALSQDRVEVNGGRLKVINLALEDSGMYQCVAENKHGTIYSNAELRVQVQVPDFRSNPVRRLVPAARGGQVMMECRPRAAPKPTLFWSRGTELLTNSSRVTVTPDGMLRIHNISRADEGKYTCFAENYLGKANSTGHLSVRDATKITLAPSNADINQGENVTLQCHASHDPTMDLTFTWALNGALLDLEDPGGPYHRKETVGDLLIVSGHLSQAGIYSCTAQTVVDSASASAKLVVRGPPGPPGGLVVKNVAATSVELRWSRGYDNHSPIGKYVIMGHSPLSPGWKRMRTDPSNIEGNAESIRVVGLLPWMDYEFQVIASNILGSGEPSMSSHTIRTQQAAPTVAPSGLGGGGGDRNELIITWTPMAREYQNGDGFGYILAFRKQNSPTWVVERVSNVESSRYVYSNQSLSPYCLFEVKIKAYNRKGEGPFSQIAVVHSAEEEPTVAPSRINATALTAFEMQVSWDPIQHLSTNGILQGYEIRYWRQHEREASADRVRTAGLETTARVVGLRPSTRYHVTVMAYNSAGTGPASPRTTVTTRRPPPNRPPGNVSWKTDGSWVTVRWDHVKTLDNESAVLGYKVLYKHEGQSALKVLDKGKTSVTLPLPKDNGYVVLEIRSWGEGGDGAAQETIVSRDSGETWTDCVSDYHRCLIISVPPCGLITCILC
uniref:Contactin 2 n=1 Tax=Oncorhynchus kisutch TaxID=8019 RepID=A0A8C7F515_ONCKI